MELCNYHLSTTRTYVWICGIFFILCNGANGQDVICNSVESDRSNVFDTYNVTVSGTTSPYNLTYDPAEYGPTMRLPVGTNEVTVTAYTAPSLLTAIGNCTFNVTVSLQELPIDCPEPVDLTVATDSGKPFYTYQDPQFNVTYLPESTTYEPYGSIMMMRTYGGSSSGPTLAISPTAHIVTITISDGTLSKSCTEATVTVEDREPPVIVCPDDIYQDHTSVDSTFQLKSMSDNSDELLDTFLSPFLIQSNGYPVGTTTYTFNSTDRAGNSASCSVNVTIEIAPTPISTEAPQTPTTQATNSSATPSSSSMSVTSTNSIPVSSMTSTPTPSTNSIPVSSMTSTPIPSSSSIPVSSMTSIPTPPSSSIPVSSMTSTSTPSSSSIPVSSTSSIPVTITSSTPVGTMNSNSVTIMITDPVITANISPVTSMTSTPVTSVTRSETTTSSSRTSQTLGSESTNAMESTSESTNAIESTSASTQKMPNNLPIIIGCSVAGGVLLIIIIILAVICSNPGRRSRFGIGAKEPNKIRHVGASRHGVATDPVLLNDRLERTRSNIYASHDIDVEMAETPEMTETNGATGGLTETNGMHFSDLYDTTDEMVGKSVL